MMRLREWTPAFVLATIAVTQAAGAPHFTIPASKHLPFASIAPATDPLAACDAQGRYGTTAPNAEKQRESQAKNNLWIVGTPVPVDFADFSTLEASIPSTLNLSMSRATLQQSRKVQHGSVGEGSLVKMVAHLKDAHIADCLAPNPPENPNGERGELVNCDFLGVKANDVHITLMPLGEPSGNECDSVTAEMIPHFRPDAWQMLDQKTPTGAPVRVTGTLFYDDSHKPCDPTTHKPAGSGNPERRSVWEIHPVYALDVCTAGSPSACDPNDNAVWIAYDAWLKTPSAHPTITDSGGARASCNALTGNRDVVAPPAPGRGRRGGQ